MVDTARLRPDRRRALALLALGLLHGRPVHAEPDEMLLGRDAGYPVGTSRDWYDPAHRVGFWSAMDRVRGAHTRTVPAGGNPMTLVAAGKVPTIRYRWEGAAFGVDDYLDHRPVTGLLVLQG